MKKIIIIGGVAGGASAAARLRRLDESARIIMLERGEYISYANCGLPYYIGGTIQEKSKLTLQTPKSFSSRFNVDVRVQNEATEIDPGAKTVTVKNHATGESYTESYDALILSPGAEPVRPPVEGVGLDRVFTLRNIPDTLRIREFIDTHKPRRAVVVGGGYIGLEMAENLHDAGLAVDVVEMLDHLVGPLDYDMACELHRHVRSKGVGLHLKNGVKAIRENGEALSVELNEGSLETDLVIMAAGVRPESVLAKQAGLELNPRGCILVDAHMRTSDPSIYAVGDAVQVEHFVSGAPSFIPLAGPANKQGRIAADNTCGRSSEYTGTQGSSILKCFDLTVAMTGLSERDAKAAGMDYEKSFTYSGSHAGYYPGATNMSIKLIFERGAGRVLGASIIGIDGVDKRCDVIATAIRAKMTVKDLTNLELCYAPPYSSAKDPVNMAGYVAENLMAGDVKNAHWHDVEELSSKGYTLLDTRTKIEFENGTIPGSINIPLDTLRGRLSELDPEKPVLVFCQVGLRGYVASRILTQNGFDALNLSGGYRLYNTIFPSQPPVFVPMEGSARPFAETAPAKQAQGLDKPAAGKLIRLDTCGLQCPGPIMKVAQAIKEADEGDELVVTATDPGFAEDIGGWCCRTGNTFEGVEREGNGYRVRIRKGGAAPVAGCGSEKNAKNIIVFSGDLDKAIAGFVIANGAVAMGRKVSMFFTFWGLNILRKPEKSKLSKTFMERMFGAMMPRGSRRLSLSKMNMGGMGRSMIRGIMRKKNVTSLEEMIEAAVRSGVELVACSMSMDVMGIKPEELIDGVKIGGVAKMLSCAEESDMSLFI